MTNSTDKTFKIDSFIRETQSFNFTIDSYIKDEFSTTTTIDAFIREEFEEAFTVDSTIQLIGLETFSVNATLVTEPVPYRFDNNHMHTIQAIISSSKTGVLAKVDARLVDRKSKTFTVDSFLSRI